MSTFTSAGVVESPTHSTDRDELLGQALPSIDLDTDEDIRKVLLHVNNSATRNFYITFNSKKASAVLDADRATISDNLDELTSNLLSTQWLAIMKPTESGDLLEHLAQRYDFVPRLLADLQSPNKRLSTTLQLPEAPEKARLRHRMSSKRSSSSTATTKSTMSSISNLSNIQQDVDLTERSIYDLAADIWHYTTLDFGRRYICCGYNAIYDCANVADWGFANNRLSSCLRVWNWIIICDDGTIITVTEDILQSLRCISARVAEQVLATTRRRLLQVVRSLSIANGTSLTGIDCRSRLTIRATINTSPDEALRQDREAPGLLFFYLFESWHSSYSLLTRNESRYGIELERLRGEMLNRPRLDHIDRLHRIGQELGVLKRHYTSYNSLVARLLEPRPVTAASLQNSRVVDAVLGDEDGPEQLPMPARESSLGVSLSTATRVRFQRLHDQIELYALSELDEYLAQKDSLVSLVSSPSCKVLANGSRTSTY